MPQKPDLQPSASLMNALRICMCCDPPSPASGSGAGRVRQGTRSAKDGVCEVPPLPQALSFQRLGDRQLPPKFRGGVTFFRCSLWCLAFRLPLCCLAFRLPLYCHVFRLPLCCHVCFVCLSTVPLLCFSLPSRFSFAFARSLPRTSRNVADNSCL